MNTFNGKIDSMESMEYIDKALQKLVSKDFIKTYLRQDLAKEIGNENKSEMDKVYEKFKSVKTKIVSKNSQMYDT